MAIRPRNKKPLTTNASPGVEHYMRPLCVKFWKFFFLTPNAWLLLRRKKCRNGYKLLQFKKWIGEIFASWVSLIWKCVYLVKLIFRPIFLNNTACAGQNSLVIMCYCAWQILIDRGGLKQFRLKGSLASALENCLKYEPHFFCSSRWIEGLFSSVENVGNFFTQRADYRPCL